MAETIKGLKRTHYCGELRPSDIGKEAVVFGWVQRQRDLGQLIFIDLRDRTGIVQLTFDDSTDREAFDKAFSARSEYVLAARGVVRERDSKNMDIPTGEVEIYVQELRVLGKAETPPFEIVENSRVKEKSLRLLGTILMKTVLLKLKPPCSSNPPRKGPGTSWCPAVSTRAVSTLCPSPPSSTSSCPW